MSNSAVLLEKMDSTPWRNDSITTRWRREHEPMLEDLSSVKSELLTEAMTYCKSYENRFAKELLTRTNLLDDFVAAKDAIGRSAVLDKAAAMFDILLF